MVTSDVLSRRVPGGSATHHVVALQELGGHGVAQFHLPVERVLLVVADQLHKALEVGGGAQHEVPAVSVDAAVLHLAPGPGGRAHGADIPQPGDSHTSPQTTNSPVTHPRAPDRQTWWDLPGAPVGKLHTSNARGTGLITGWALRSSMLCGVSKKKKKKS